MMRCFPFCFSARSRRSGIGHAELREDTATPALMTPEVETDLLLILTFAQSLLLPSTMSLMRSAVLSQTP
eukprot:15143120-Heterocapsa_arctica.AAC.1